jgi:hypothetical protein
MILRFEIDGIEYFINTLTFEVGLSISGLARLCGVSHEAITQLLKKIESLMHKNPLEEAQTQASNDESLMHKIQKSGLPKTPSEAAQIRDDDVKLVTPKTQKSVVSKNTPEVVQTKASNDKSVVSKNQKAKAKRGRPKHTEEELPECLKLLLDGDIYLGTGNEYKNATILNERACAAILYYYVTESDTKPDEAKKSLWAFQRMGFRTWVHSVTGWTPPTPVSPAAPLLTRAEALGIKPRHHKAEFDRFVFYNTLINKAITAPMYRVYFYFLDCDLTEHRPTPEEVSQIALVAKHSLYDLVERMRPLKLVPDWFTIDDSTRAPEAQIRDRLHTKLGGDIEVQTIYGPIDLVTATEIIEIKKIDDWKDGFGQILVKCKKFPAHSKRLHLFGNSDRTLRNIKARCKEFDVNVSYEECNLTTV